MKPFRATLVTGLLATILTPLPVSAQAADTDKKDRTITVAGSSSVKYRPEGAKIAFGVRASDNAFATAWKDNQTQADKLRTALEGLKIAGLQIKIAPPEVTQNDNGAVLPGVVPGGMNDKAFNVMRSFQVVITDADFAQLHKQLLKVMEAALTHGANCPANLPLSNNQLLGGLDGGFPQSASITRVDFFHRDDVAFRKQAYAKAVQAALANAQGLALGAELKLGGVLSITDQQDVNPAIGYRAGLPTIESNQQEFNGEIELTVRVRVSLKF